MNIRGVTATFSLFVLSMVTLHAQSIDLSTSKQLIEEIPGPSAAPQQSAHLDGRLARQALRGYGQRRLRNLRVAVRPVAGRARYADRHGGRFSRRPHAGAHRPSRRSIPASRSAATEPISTPAWVRSPIPPVKRKATPGMASSCTASTPAKSRRSGSSICPCSNSRPGTKPA